MYCVIQNDFKIVCDRRTLGDFNYEFIIRYFNEDRIEIVYRNYLKTISLSIIEDIRKGLDEVMRKVYCGGDRHEYNGDLSYIEANSIGDFFNGLDIYFKDKDGYFTHEDDQKSLFIQCYSIEQVRNLYKTLTTIYMNRGWTGIKEYDSITEDELNKLAFYEYKMNRVFRFNPLQIPFEDKFQEIWKEYNKVTPRQSVAIRAILDQMKFESWNAEDIEISNRLEASKFIKKHEEIFERAKKRNMYNKELRKSFINSENCIGDNECQYINPDELEFFAHTERY